MAVSQPALAPAAEVPTRWKVCLASRAPFVGGAEVAAERLALGLQAAGHEAFLLLGREGAVAERLRAAGLRCEVAPLATTDKWRPWRSWASWRAARGVFRRERPDLLHSNDLPTHQMVAGAARGLGVPRVCHHRFVYDGPAVDWFNKYGAERHLFVSRALMEELAAGSASLRREPRAVVYDGLALPPRPSEADRLRARDRLGLPRDRRLVAFAGQVIERKGVADLLRSWSLLADGPARDADLLVIGDDLQGNGRYRAEMERLAAELRCPAQFVGFRKDVGEWLTAADVAVVPSHVEPLGNATLEAMSYALPVVGSAVGGIPEMIVPERTGLLVLPHAPPRLAEALARLLGDPALARRLGEEGRRRCEEVFSLEAHVRAVLEQYRLVGPRSLAGAGR
jgi:glycosyltransferase involved in cell wall biosynthesis